ncbi:SDR family oxidoreductase [Streptomyces sp. TR06-5]|uniref:SDR family oxidoreductase n=1 Tax=unclassified Streptomyces TaxID=2593676 RepID=UPI0039A26C34
MDQPVLVTGGRGSLGRPTVERLLSDGVAVRVMSRRERPPGDDRPYGWARADLRSGRGLPEALHGVGAVVHCATDGRTDVRQTRRLVEEARKSGARPHLVYISIVGVDRIPFFYYRQKLAAERLVESSGLPWTILRATQFHGLVAGMTLAQRRLPVVFTLRGLRIQPVAVTEVADRLAALAQEPAAGRVPEMGGPRVRDAVELARATLRAAGRHRRVVPLRLPGRTAAAFRAGYQLCPERAVGTGTFEEFLAERVVSGRL